MLARAKLEFVTFAASVNPVDVSVRNGSMAEMQKINSPPYVSGDGCRGSYRSDRR
jgi:hypothetical protein